MNCSKLILLSFILSLSSFANDEVDDFSKRKEILGISSEDKAKNLYAANDQVNKYIRAAVKEFNVNKSCVEDMKQKPPIIYHRMKRILTGGMREGSIGEWAAKSKSIVKSKGDQHLYGEAWGVEASFNLNGHVVGIDKLHQFGNYGFQVFEEAFLKKGGNFRKGLDFNNELEDYVYGINFSGVKSYGDMAANFSGMQFYMNLLHGDNKYLSCNQSTGKYKVERDFDWADYVNDSWDEGINCSKFYKANYPYSKWKNKEQDENVIQEQSFLSSFSDNDYISLAGSNYKKRLKGKQMSCPDNLNKCKELGKLKCASFYLSPDCLKRVGYINQHCPDLKLGEFSVPSSNSGYSYSRPDSGTGTGSNTRQK